MAGQPYADRNKGKARGQKRQDELDEVLSTLLPKVAGQDQENPLTTLRRLREAAYDEIVKERVKEVDDIQSGRTVVTEQMCWDVIGMLESGTSILDACRARGHNFSGVFKKVMTDEKMKQAVDHAREMYAHGSVERMRHLIMTEGDPARARVLTDLLKWETSKVLPKFYGDRIDVTTGDKVSFSINMGVSPTPKADK